MAKHKATKIRQVSTAGVEVRGYKAGPTKGSIGKEPYDRSSRIKLALKYGILSKTLSGQGFTVIIATISMFNEIYSWNRENLPGYFEIFLKVPLEELKRRDDKGIYGHYESGLIQDVPGLDINIDEPKNSDWVELYNNGKETSVLAEELIQVLNQDLANEN